MQQLLRLLAFLLLLLLPLPAAEAWQRRAGGASPEGRHFHTAVWTGADMIVWGGIGAALTSNVFTSDTFGYTPGGDGSFRITGIARNGASLVITFPSVTDRSYSLWISDNMAAGTWTNTGLASLAGTGAPLTFSVPAPSPPAHRFFRVQQSGP